MTDVTCILSAIEEGEPRAAERLLPLVYEQLRKLAAHKLAHEKPGQTLHRSRRSHMKGGIEEVLEAAEKLKATV